MGIGQISRKGGWGEGLRQASLFQKIGKATSLLYSFAVNYLCENQVKSGHKSLLILAPKVAFGLSLMATNYL